MANRLPVAPSQFVGIAGYDQASDAWFPLAVDPTTGAVIQKSGTDQVDQLTNGQVALPASSGGSRQIVAARAGRTSVVIVNGALDVYLGSDPNVTTSNGLRLPANAAVNIPGGAAVYAINSSNTTGVTVSYMEAY